MEGVVLKKHASKEVRTYAMYCYYKLGLTFDAISLLFGKDKSTIKQWHREFTENGGFKERTRERIRHKFSDAECKWLVDYYNANPLAYLNEASIAFTSKFLKKISL